MNCEDFENYIESFVEDSLNSTLNNEMEQHCASCPKCAGLAEFHNVVFSSLNNTKPVRAPEGLEDRILAAIESEAPDNVIEFTPAAELTGKNQAPGKIPLDCRVFEDRIAAYVDGELRGSLLEEFESHRTSCQGCEQLVNAHRTVLASLNTAETIQAPEGLTDRIFARIEAEVIETEKAFETEKPFGKFSIIAATVTAVGSLIAASVIAVIGISTQTTTFTMPESVNVLAAQITALPLLLRAWLAGIIPVEYWHQINLLLDPLNIPYLSMAIPPVYFVAFLLLAASGWFVLRRPIEYNIPVETSY